MKSEDILERHSQICSHGNKTLYLFRTFAVNQGFALVIDFHEMWWLLKEPFLATYSAMSNPHSTKQGAVAPKRAIV